MFNIFKYENDFLGISIQRNEIELGDENFFDRLKFIKLDNRIPEFWIISFKKNISENELKIYVSLFNEMHSEDDSLTLEHIINKLSELFDLYKTKDSEASFIGLITELVFIYSCQKRNIDVGKYYQYNNDKFDFSLPNNTYLEIKHISEIEKAIIISHSQLEKLTDNDYVIGIRLHWDSHSGLNIQELLNKISLSPIQCKYISSRIDELNQNDLTKKVNVEKSTFRIIENRCIPKIKEDPKSIVMEAVYKLYALGINESNDEFFTKLKEVING